MDKNILKEKEKIAEEAYIYAFPMLMGYRFAFATFLTPGLPSMVLGLRRRLCGSYDNLSTFQTPFKRII